ncbi:Pycsar system effector family protein [Streptomyces sp. NPDC006992]|uniref:Pycsar system effector family protein n=1 Tax=unclassified Streptomyces TaxID=2593676 RepID=UPI0033DE3243
MPDGSSGFPPRTPPTADATGRGPTPDGDPVPTPDSRTPADPASARGGGVTGTAPVPSAAPGRPSPGSGPGGTPDALEAAWRIHAAVGEWTSRADVKASVVLALETAVLAAVFTLLVGPDGGGPGSRILLLRVAALLLGAGALSAVLVVLPRMRGSHMSRESPDSFVYFGHLRTWNPVRLAEALHGDVLRVLTRDIVVCSAIAWRKHRMLQLSIGLAAAGGSLLLCAELAPIPG